MGDLPFTHNQRSYLVKTRREGDRTIAEVFSADGSSANFTTDATDEMLSDMRTQGHADPVKRLQEEARDGFTSRNT